MDDDGIATVTVDVAIGGERVEGEIPVPTGPTAPRELLPVFRALAETVVEIAVRAAERRGQTVSCRAGCGACCRQIVPIAPLEARLLAELLEAFPEPRRSIVKQRFVAARERLAEAGLLEKVEHPELYPDGD